MKNRQTINEIMKNHEPWTVGVCTDRSNNTVFYPVAYNKNIDRWYGYVERVVYDIIELETAWRKGTTKRYKVKETETNPLLKKDPIFKWIQCNFPKRDLLND